MNIPDRITDDNAPQRYGEGGFRIRRYAVRDGEAEALPEHHTPPLDPDAIRRLFAYAVASDNRDVSDAALTVWSDHAIDGRWTEAEALGVMRAHYRDSPGVWLMPGHITAGIMKLRNAAHDARQLEAQRVVDPDAAAKVRAHAAELAVAMGRKFVSVADVTEFHPRGLHVPCEHCGAVETVPCRLGGRHTGMSERRRASATHVHAGRLVAELAFVNAARAEAGLPALPDETANPPVPGRTPTPDVDPDQH
jgi:hypothetical protein